MMKKTSVFKGSEWGIGKDSNLKPTDGCGIYVHVPFCRSRCLYCAFYSLTGKADMAAKYFDALSREYVEWKEWMLAHAPVRTVYFGGGTPSIVEPELITGFMAQLRDISVEASRLEEVTLEVNPEDVREEKVQAWSRAGITRFSMGVQSLVDTELRGIGRRHTADQVREAALMLGQYGDLSLDLICGLPGQTLESFSYSLKSIIGLRPGHISIYMLELEEDSALSRLVKAGKKRVPDENMVEEMYLTLCRELLHAGYEHYEISNFALPGHRSGHNCSYWNGRPYIGLGAAAAGYPTPNRRYVNPPDIDAYINNNVSELREWECLSTIEITEEYILTRLRTDRGINIDDYAVRFGEKELCRLLDNAEEYIRRGLLLKDTSLRLASPRACLLSDAIMTDLIREIL